MVSFLGVTGNRQVEDSVAHLVAEKLSEPKVKLKPIRYTLAGTSVKTKGLVNENFMASPTGFEPVLPAGKADVLGQARRRGRKW